MLEFREFLNFGGDLQDAVDGNLTGRLVSENQILTPVFDISSQRLKVRVPSGQTVVVGDMVKKREQWTEDSLPVIGLYHAKKVVERRFVYMFVKPLLHDAAGIPLN